jgi:hypothetical protein
LSFTSARRAVPIHWPIFTVYRSELRPDFWPDLSIDFRINFFQINFGVDFFVRLSAWRCGNALFQALGTSTGTIARA